MKKSIVALSVLAAAALALTGMTSSAFGGFGGAVSGSATATTATAVLRDSVTGGTGNCTSTGAGTTTDVNTVSCPDSALPNGAVSSSPSTTTSTIALSNLSTPNTSTPSLAVPTCGLQSVADSAAAADTGIVHKTMTFGTTGALTGGTAVTLTQSSSAYVATVKPYTNPTNFSIAGWFNFPANSSSGTLIGFTDSHTDSGQSAADRSLWLSSRRISWGVNNGTKQVVTSTINLTAGAWHFVVATVGSNGQNLYVDNQAVVSNAAVTSAANYTGYWHLGFGDETTGWGGTAPTNAYWPGSLENVAVIPSQLTAAQVSTLYSQTTDAAEVTALNALTPTNLWRLNDTGKSTFTGTVPAAGASGWMSDITGSGNTLVNPSNLVTWNSSGGPLGGSAYATFNGADYLTSTTQYTNPQGYTVTAYFKAPIVPTGSGPIFEFTNTQLQGPATWDRHAWLDANGHMVYGVYPNAVKEVTSAANTNYADNAWHQVTASNGAAGLKVYVDGTLVAVDTTVTTSQVFNGYWHIGWGNVQTGWTNPPTNAYFTGGVTEMAVIPTQLSDAAVAALGPTQASTPAALNTAIMALNPTVYWPMQATVSGGSRACAGLLASVQITNGATTTCAYPAGSGACPTPSGLLSALSSGVSLTPGAAQTVTLTITKSGVPGSLSGTHAFATVQFSVTAGSFGAVLSHALSGSMDL